MVRPGVQLQRNRQSWPALGSHEYASRNHGYPTIFHRTDFWNLGLWVSRWNSDLQIDEVKTYVDAGKIITTLQQNEIWWNSTEHITHTEFVPGPGGMPPWLNATGVEEWDAEKGRWMMDL
jgi:hypothetical protein